MWILIILFAVTAGIAVILRSPKTLLVLAISFAFVAILYTPFWPFVLVLFALAGYTKFLIGSDNKKSDEEDWKKAINEELQNEVEIGDFVRRLERAEKKMK